MKRLTGNKAVMSGIVAIILTTLVPVLVGSALTGHPLSRTAIAAGA
jgi:hypothetical protein